MEMDSSVLAAGRVRIAELSVEALELRAKAARLGMEAHRLRAGIVHGWLADARALDRDAFLAEADRSFEILAPTPEEVRQVRRRIGLCESWMRATVSLAELDGALDMLMAGCPPHEITDVHGWARYVDADDLVTPELPDEVQEYEYMDDLPDEIPDDVA